MVYQRVRHRTIGENDTLSAIVAQCVGAELLILLSDIDGLYTADPRRDDHAALIPEVRSRRLTALTKFCRRRGKPTSSAVSSNWATALAGAPGSALGTGGMATKLKAAEIAMACGCDMVIANGQRPKLLYDSGGLLGGHVRRTAGQVELAHPHADGPGGHQHQLVPRVFQIGQHLHQLLHPADVQPPGGVGVVR